MAGRGARRALEHKVKLLERCARRGINPDPSVKLILLKDVQEWRGRQRRDRPSQYGTWSSFTVAAPGGTNGDLRTRLDDVLPEIVAIQAGEQLKPGKKLRRGRSLSNAQLRRENDTLSAQVDKLIEERDDERADRIRAEQSLEICQKLVAQLKADLAKFRPLRSV